MTAAVPDPREDIDWSAHRGSCRVFYAERRCTCGASPAEPTGELREAVVETLHAQGCREDSDGSGCGGHCVDDADALLSGPLADVVQEAAESGKRLDALIGVRAKRDALLAKLRAVEELAAERTAEGSWVIRGKLRRALDGES